MENVLGKWYKDLSYKELKGFIRDNLQCMKRECVATGYYLKYIRDHEQYKEDGYSSIWEFAEDQYGISRSTCSRWMKINDMFSEDGNSPALAEKYKDFERSQLQEMLYLEDHQLEQVTPDMTIKDIRKLREEPKEEPVSILGYPLRVYPEGSLIATPGCGKQDCFSCHHDGCDLRQEECRCVEAPCGNPFPCTTIDIVENLRVEVGEKCQFVNSDLAYHRAGDGEPVPCCKECTDQCKLACDRAIHARSELKKSESKTMCDVAHDEICIHRAGFHCTLSESSKLTTGDGVDCYKKCCWDCPKRGDCEYKCNSASAHPVKPAEEQLPGQMTVEDFPELLPETQEQDVIDEQPEIVVEMPEIVSESEDSVTEPEENVIDAEYREVHSERVGEECAAENTEVCCQKAADLDEFVFSEIAIRDYLEEEEMTLAEYEKVNLEDGGLPLNLMMRQRMLVKALRLLMENEADQDAQEEISELEEPELVQPELPVFKNNDQRKEWLRNHRDWGLWYEDTNIGARYYKYDFDNGARLIAEEYTSCGNEYIPDFQTAYLHLVGGPEPPKHEKYGYGKWQRNKAYNRHPNNETELVEFLKFTQKGAKK